MPSLAPRDLIKSLANRSSESKIYLLHGPNDELKSDLFAEVRKARAIELDDPFRLSRLDGDELDSDQGRLADELSSISMFGGSRLVHVKATPRQAERAIRIGQATPRNDCTLVVACGPLSDAEWLTDVIGASDVVAIECGDERPGDFHAFVLNEFRKAELEIDDAAVELLLQLVGDDRAGIRSEIAKLCFLVGAGGRIEVQHIKDVVADGASIVADEVALAAFSGDSRALSRGLDKLAIAGSDPGQALAAAFRLAMTLHRSKVRQWSSRGDPNLAAWNANELRGLARSLNAAILSGRSDSANAALLAERTLTALAMSAARKRR